MADDSVYIHMDGATCWCHPDVTPIGIGHHATVGETHELTSGSDVVSINDGFGTIRYPGETP